MNGLGLMVMLLAAGPMAGRPLADALEALRVRGVRLIYSSDLVRPGMKVQAEPRSASPRAALDEVLAPHGLRARKGPAGTVLVVKAQPAASAPLPTGLLRVVAWRRDEQRALAGVGVRVNGETRTDATDAEGRVLLAGLRPGLYAVEARLDGFTQERSEAISVAAGSVAELRVEMTPQARGETELPLPRVLELSVLQAAQLQEAIEVKGEARPAASGPDALQLRPQQVASVPGTADNLFRALTLWSGVFGVNDVESRLAVRGGAPDENLVVVDGVEVANPFRIVGLTSMFHPEFLKSFELNRGVLHPRYGDRLSSALVVETRDGNPARRVGGTASLNVIDAQLLLEGRLAKAEKASWLLVGRTTWLGKLAGLISPGSSGPLGFDDLALKLAWEPAPGRRLSLLGLAGRDALDGVQAGPPGGGSGTADRTRLLSTRYGGTWGRRGWAASTLGLYSLEHALEFDNRDADVSLQREFAQTYDPDQALFSFRRELSLRDLSFRQELGVQGEHAALEGGLELHRVQTRFGWSTARDPRGRGPIPSGYAVEAFDTTRAGVWMHARLRPRARLLLEPGLRVEHSGGHGTLAPRLFGTFQLGPSWRARASLGIQHQSPGFEKFLLRDTPLESDAFFEASAAHRLRPERMRQAQLGLERDLGGGLQARAEVYARGFDHLVVGRLETPAETQARLDRYDLPAELQSQLPAGPLVTRVPENAGTGRAYGFELSLRRTEGAAGRRLAGEASYAFSLSERDLNGATIPFDFDRRHSLTGAATLRLWGRLSLITLGRFGSGFPRSEASGLRVAVEPDAGDADGDGDRDELVPARDYAGRLRYLPVLVTPSERNRSRLPVYARIDLRLAHEPRGPKGFGWYLEWLNVLDRRNPIYMESIVETDPRGLPRLRQEPGSWFPRLFSGGLRWRF